MSESVEKWTVIPREEITEIANAGPKAFHTYDYEPWKPLFFNRMSTGQRLGVLKHASFKLN